MSEMVEVQSEYLTAIGALLRDAELGTSQGLYAMEDLDAFLQQDAQALFGVSWETLKAAGLDLWHKASPKLHGLFCDPAKAEHKTLASLVVPGATEVSAAVVGIITTQILGLVPAVAAGTIAYFLAKMVLTTFFTEAYNTACDSWKKTLVAEKPEDPGAG